MAITTVSITGHVLTPSGGAVTSGTIDLMLSAAGSILDGASSERLPGGKWSGPAYRITLESGGALPATAKVAPNDAVTPSGTYYTAKFTCYTAASTTVPVVWTETWQLTGMGASVAIGAIPRLNAPTLGASQLLAAYLYAEASSDAEQSAAANAGARFITRLDRLSGVTTTTTTTTSTPLVTPTVVSAAQWSLNNIPNLTNQAGDIALLILAAVSSAPTGFQKLYTGGTDNIIWYRVCDGSSFAQTVAMNGGAVLLIRGANTTTPFDYFTNTWNQSGLTSVVPGTGTTAFDHELILMACMGFTSGNGGVTFSSPTGPATTLVSTMSETSRFGVAYQGEAVSAGTAITNGGFTSNSSYCNGGYLIYVKPMGT